MRVRTKTRKIKRGGGPNNEDTLRIVNSANESHKQVEYKVYTKIPLRIVDKYKNQTKRNNLLKERYVTWITFNTEKHDETKRLLANINQQLGLQQKSLLSGKVYEVGIINNIRAPLRKNAATGTLVDNANIGNAEDTLFPSNVASGNTPLLQKHTSGIYFLNKGVGLKGLSIALNDLKIKRGVKYVILVPMNEKLEQIYTTLGFVPVDNVKHTLSYNLPTFNTIYYGGPNSANSGKKSGRAMYKEL